MHTHIRFFSPSSEPYLLRPVTFATSYLRASSYESVDSSTDCDGEPSNHELNDQVTEYGAGFVSYSKAKVYTVDPCPVLNASLVGLKLACLPYLDHLAHLTQSLLPKEPTLVDLNANPVLNAAGGSASSTVGDVKQASDSLGPPSSFPYCLQLPVLEETSGSSTMATEGPGPKRTSKKNKVSPCFLLFST